MSGLGTECIYTVISIMIKTKEECTVVRKGWAGGSYLLSTGNIDPQGLYNQLFEY
jgi:hypothetical protein